MIPAAKQFVRVYRCDDNDQNDRFVGGPDGRMSKPLKIEGLRAMPERGRDAVAPVPTEPAPGRLEAKSVLNQDMLARLRELGPGSGILCELIDMFLAETPGQIGRLRLAVEEGKPAVLRQIAHTLKGSAGNLGADRLSMVCSELEKLAKTGAVHNAEKLLAEVQSEYREAEKQLAAEKLK